MWKCISASMINLLLCRLMLSKHNLNTIIIFISSYDLNYYYKPHVQGLSSRKWIDYYCKQLIFILISKKGGKKRARQSMKKKQSQIQGGKSGHHFSTLKKLNKSQPDNCEWPNDWQSQESVVKKQISQCCCVVGIFHTKRQCRLCLTPTPFLTK